MRTYAYPIAGIYFLVASLLIVDPLWPHMPTQAAIGIALLCAFAGVAFVELVAIGFKHG